MKYFKIGLLFLISHLYVSAQSSNAQETLTSNNSYITFNPTTIADPFAPRLRAGYIQNLSTKWKIGAEMGYGNKGMTFLTSDVNTGIEYSLWEIRPEVFYILNPERKTVKYFSAELFYINQSNVFVDGDFRDASGTDFDFDRANFTRQKYGLHLKYGLFLDIGKRMGLNFFGGLGFRYKNNTYSNVINPVENSRNRELFLSPHDVDGNGVNVNLSLGLKLYYKI